MISVNDIKSMNYVDFMALLDEVNRPPGGKNSLRILAQNTFITSESKILDVGCNTGFVTFEIANLANCSVIGIDISKKMITSANNYLKQNFKNLKNKVKFIQGDAMAIPYPDNTFDLVVSGGSTAFVKDIPKVVNEYARVVRPWGYIGEINFYFHTRPPISLIRKLNDLMGISIQSWKIDYWLNQYKKTGLELFYCYEDKMNSVSDNKVIGYVNYLIDQKKWRKDVQQAAKNRLINIYRSFNEEHKYLAYGVFILRKRSFDEVTLF